ncbi:MAG: SufB/SufD family protein [Candidatus Woesearchaeota archaeon]
MNKESYLKKFHELKIENIRSGLGIGTRIDWIDLDSEYKKSGNTVYETNAVLLEESDDSIIHDIEIKKIIDAPVLENKFDYLHNAMRIIKILSVEEDGVFELTRKIVGNQYNHLIIRVAENINATIYINTSSINNLSIATEFLDIVIGDNSNVSIVDVRNYGNQYFVYSRKNAYIKNNSELKWTNVEGPSKLNITQFHSIINGHNSGSIMNVLVLSRRSEYNIFTRTDHNFANTKSLMQTRNIMDHSKAIMRGLVYINKDANNSNGYQKSEMMMLDNFSHAISIPDLEIHNDEVKCTHGSSITRPDPEKLFYLQSRGLDDSESRRLLIKGFYDCMLSQIPNGLKDVVSADIEKIVFDEKL